jgi:hypothetical protein
MWATISIVGMLFMQPTDPGKANPRTVVQLQQFSWTEAALEDCIKVRVLPNLGLVTAFWCCRILGTRLLKPGFESQATA